MKKIVLDRIVSLEDVAARDGVENGRAWLLKKCAEAMKAKKFSVAWDGETVEGEPVRAFINNGRWGARCKVCNSPQYVSANTAVLFCVECGNGNSGKAWGVEFPAEREEIETALLAREVVIDESRLIRNIVELSFSVRPKVPGLARHWRTGIRVEEIEQETEALKKGSKKR